MLMFPKPTRKQKKRKPIARKARFRANENPTKCYKSSYSGESVQAFAEKCRQIRLNNPTEAELAFADILRELAVEFEREHIEYYANGSHFILADFYFPASRTIIEIDGGVHNLQQRYDRGRDAYFESQGIKTLRFTNRQVLKEPEAVAARIREVVND